MAFEIQWTGSLGPTKTQRDSPADALKSAMEWLEKGCTDVVIVDLSKDGKAYAPADFAEFYKEAGK
jgi:hypothetical protein